MIKEENYAMIWGTVFLVVGLIILSFVFISILGFAQNPSEKIEQWAPEEIKGPNAAFMWWSRNNSVEFSDASVEGSAEIASWNWDFGDGKTGFDKNPNYEYSEIGEYTVILEIEDENGNSHSAKTRVTLFENESNEGQTQASMSFDLGLESTLNRMIILIVVLVAYSILGSIGGKMLYAGCRLIRPSVNLYKTKSKQKETKNDSQER